MKVCGKVVNKNAESIEIGVEFDSHDTNEWLKADTYFNRLFTYINPKNGDCKCLGNDSHISEKPMGNSCEKHEGQTAFPDLFAAFMASVMNGNGECQKKEDK